MGVQLILWVYDSKMGASTPTLSYNYPPMNKINDQASHYRAKSHFLFLVVSASGGASSSAVVRQTISGYEFVAMCQQR